MERRKMQAKAEEESEDERSRVASLAVLLNKLLREKNRSIYLYMLLVNGNNVRLRTAPIPEWSLFLLSERSSLLAQDRRQTLYQ